MVKEASELLNEMRLAITERLTSPLVGTYWISWFIWNFKFLLVIFSSEAIESKLTLIHEEMFWSPWGYAVTYGGPLLMTAAFIFLYPYPARRVYELRLKFLHQLNVIKQKEEDEELLSAPESRRLRLEIREKERSLNARLDDSEKEITDLRKENASLKSRVAEFSRNTVSEDRKQPAKSRPQRKKKNPDPSSQRVGKLTAIELEVFKDIASSAPEARWHRYLVVSVQDEFPDIGNMRMRTAIDDAVDELGSTYGLIRIDGTGDNRMYSLTSSGQKFAVENNF